MLGGCEIPRGNSQAARATRVELAALVDDPKTIKPGRRIKLEPCESAATLKLIRQETGRPCPRAELDHDNEVPATLFWLHQGEQGRPYVQPYLDAVREQQGPEVALLYIARVWAAANDPEIVQQLELRHQKAIESARNEARNAAGGD